MRGAHAAGLGIASKRSDLEMRLDWRLRLQNREADALTNRDNYEWSLVKFQDCLHCLEVMALLRQAVRSVAQVSALRAAAPGTAVLCRALPSVDASLSQPAAPLASVGLGAPLSKRNAGVSVLGCAIAMVAVGGCAQAGHG
eukprot:s4180_g1.t1